MLTVGFLTISTGSIERYAVPDGTNGIRIRRAADDVEISGLHDPARKVRRIHGFSPDGRYLAATYRGQKHWTIWDVSMGRVVLDDPRCRHAIAFSRDGERLAASHPDGRILLYELPSGVEAASVNAGRPLEWLSLNSSGDRVLGCDRLGGKAIRVWTFATGAALTLTAPDLLDNADWGGDDLIAAGSYLGRIHVWSAQSGQPLHSIAAHEENAEHVTFNHRGDRLASTSWDGTTRFCNPWTGQLYLTFPHGSQAPQFSLDDRQFSLTKLALGRKSQFAFLEMEESSVMKRIEHGGTVENAWTLAFSPDGRWLAAADGDDGGVRLYDADTRRLLASLPECTGRMVLFEPGGKSLLTGGPEGISRWALSESRIGPATTVRFGPRQPISTLTGILHGALTPDGRWLACTSKRATNDVWLVDLANPDQPIGLGRHRSVLHVAISPDGEWVASGNWQGMEGVELWRTRTRTLEKTIPMETVLLAYSPDGRWLAVSGVPADHSFQNQIWETGSWTLRHSWTDQNHRNQPVFSPDSRLVAFVSERRKIRLYEVQSFRHLATLEAPSRTFIGWLQFSPDGHRLAALEWTHGIQLWDLPALRQELQVRGLDWETEPLEKLGRR